MERAIKKERERETYRQREGESKRRGDRGRVRERDRVRERERVRERRRRRERERERGRGTERERMRERENFKAIFAFESHLRGGVRRSAGRNRFGLNFGFRPIGASAGDAGSPSQKKSPRTNERLNVHPHILTTM